MDRSFKYVQGSVEVLDQLARACRGPAVERARLFNWLVFNALTGNGDAHLKNLSFLVSGTGIYLAKHYDLLSTAVYGAVAFDKNEWPAQTPLAWPILHARSFAQLDRDVLLDAGEAMSIQRSTARRLIDALCLRIVDTAKALLQEFETQANELRGRPGLAATLAGESRCLRAIVYAVIAPMAARLA